MGGANSQVCFIILNNTIYYSLGDRCMWIRCWTNKQITVSCICFALLIFLASSKSIAWFYGKMNLRLIHIHSVFFFLEIFLLLYIWKFNFVKDWCLTYNIIFRSCFGQTLQPSTFFPENFFVICITIYAVVVFVFLVGNMQVSVLFSCPIYLTMLRWSFYMNNASYKTDISAIWNNKIKGAEIAGTWDRAVDILFEALRKTPKGSQEISALQRARNETCSCWRFAQ